MILHKKTMSSWKKDAGPILVHCSAGVGCTGTFIALDMALDQAAKEKVVDLAGIINRLREQRAKMVQTVVSKTLTFYPYMILIFSLLQHQFTFLHDAVLEAVMCGATKISTQLFKNEYSKLVRFDPNTGVSGMATQFELLYQVTPNPNDVIRISALLHSSKNRDNQYLPSKPLCCLVHCVMLMYSGETSGTTEGGQWLYQCIIHTSTYVVMITCLIW